MENSEVTYRSEIRVTPHKYGYKYEYDITLTSGETFTFMGYAHGPDVAMNAAIERSQRMIDRGYPDGDFGGLSVETFGTYKGGGRLRL